MTDGEEDSDSVEEGEVWEEEGGYLARFPDPLLEVGRGYSVSIPW